MLRHPNIVKYIDGVDADTIVVIITEPVTPLLQYIQVKKWASNFKKTKKVVESLYNIIRINQST